MKKALSAAWNGVSIAAFIFVLSSLILGLAAGGQTFASGQTMARTAAATILIGLGFGLPSLIYETDLSLALQTVIHMGTGCLVMTAAALWLRPEMGAGPFLAVLAGQIALAFLIWGGQLLRARSLARQVNRRIADKNGAV